MTPHKGRRRAMLGHDPIQMAPIPPASSYDGHATVGATSQAVSPSSPPSRRTYLVRRIAVVAIALAVLLGASTAFAVWRYKASVDQGLATALVKLDPKVSAALAPAPKASSEPFYMLILGADMRPGDKQANSDTLILARVDPRNKHIALISIPRDTRAAIPGHGTEKINAAMMYGGPSLVIQTVRQLTGLPVSHFVQVNFWGFKQMVDAVGGVWVNVPTRIFDPKAANHDYTAELIKPGYQKLDGKHALTFVRSRNFPMADYVRMKNQQVFIKALLKQTLQAGNIFKINAITGAMLKNVVTDMKVDQILSLASDFRDMNPKTVETATMPSTPKMVYGIDYVVLDDAAMRDMIAKLAAGRPIDKTAQASAVAAASQAASSVVDPKTVTVDVRNGAGGKAVASTNAAKLSAAGFVIQKTGNAARFVYPQTLVIYKDDQGAAQAVQAALGFGTLVMSENRYSFTSKVLVVVGMDWTTAATASAAAAAPQ